MVLFLFAAGELADGFTIVTQNENISVSYCHVSPKFIVSRGDAIIAGNIVANVGPKNIYSIINNPYKDTNGNPTNGATTRLSPSPHNKKRRRSRQSFRLF